MKAQGDYDGFLITVLRYSLDVFLFVFSKDFNNLLYPKRKKNKTTVSLISIITSKESSTISVNITLHYFELKFLFQ